MTKKRRIFSLLISLLFSIMVLTVNAAANETQNTGFAGITTAVAQKIVTSNVNQVNCTSISYTKNPYTNITHIGYNTFSCTVQRSDGVYNQVKDLNGNLDYNDWHQSKLLISTVEVRTPYSRNGTSAGSHDFGQFDGTSHNWDPPLSAQQTFYP